MLSGVPTALIHRHVHPATLVSCGSIPPSVLESVKKDRLMTIQPITVDNRQVTQASNTPGTTPSTAQTYY